MLSLKSLQTPLTRAQAQQRITELLTSLGFQTTAWQEGSIQRTTVTLLSIMYSDLSEVVKAIAEFGFNSFASGDALREFSRSRYDQDKFPAVKTRGTIRLTSTASIPYTIQPGQLLVATVDGVQFRNVTGGTLAAGTAALPKTLDLTFESVLAGELGNVDEGAITRLVTPLAGVTVNNNVGTPWYSIAGADEESDESLRLRNATKWATLTVELVRESYEHIARTTGARKVKVDDSNPRGPGTLDVYASREATLLGQADMEALQAEFARRALYTDETWHETWPPGNLSRVATRHPARYELDLTATLYHDPAVSGATIVTRAREALTDYLRRTPIGGWDYAPGPTNVIKQEDVIDLLKELDGVRSLTLASGDKIVSPTALVVEGTWSLTTVPVEG